MNKGKDNLKIEPAEVETCTAVTPLPTGQIDEQKVMPNISNVAPSKCRLKYF
jgi:hypothetical protein